MSMFPTTLRNRVEDEEVPTVPGQDTSSSVQRKQRKNKSPKVNNAYLRGVGVWVNLIFIFTSLCIFYSEFYNHKKIPFWKNSG